MWLAPTAQVIGNVVLAREASIWFSAIVRGDNVPIVALDGEPGAEGRLSIDGSPPSPPTCRSPPIAEPSTHRASDSRSLSRGGWCPACSRSRSYRPATGAAPAAGAAG